MLLPSPSSMRAIVSTPAEPDGAWVARFPSGGNLPRINGGSASALLVSRPAQRLLRVMARMVAEPPKAVLLSECFSPYRCLYGPLRLLPAGATVAGRDSHPQGNGAFPRRTPISAANYSRRCWKPSPSCNPPGSRIFRTTAGPVFLPMPEETSCATSESLLVMGLNFRDNSPSSYFNITRQSPIKAS